MIFRLHEDKQIKACMTYIAVRKVLCFCIFDELHHPRVCNICVLCIVSWKSETLISQLMLQDVYHSQKNKMTWHEYVLVHTFFLSQVYKCNIWFINGTISKMNSYHADIAIIPNASALQITLLGIQFNSIFQSIQMTFLSVMIQWYRNQTNFKHRNSAFTHLHTHNPCSFPQPMSQPYWEKLLTLLCQFS